MPQLSLTRLQTLSAWLGSAQLGKFELELITSKYYMAINEVYSLIHIFLPDLCYDVDYFILNDETRNLNYIGQDYCDSTFYQSRTSPDWKGTSWYRFDSPGGTKIPEHSLEYLHCNTYAPGWLNGTHPTNLGETVERKVCFNYPNHVCQFERNIQIKNCGAYFLYYLKDVSLNYRYCAETDF